MYWNLGGNFKPVATACQYSEWTTCLASFIEYIWFEVVTDVADCLASEAILWRVLAVLLSFGTIVYFVYWKSQWAREVKRNGEKFVAVDHKLQDLELKVDIITYKSQYGIWPLQCLQETNNLANLNKFQIGLSQFSLDNSWIKNLLERGNEKQYFLKKYPDMQEHFVQNYSRTDKMNSPHYDYDYKILSDTKKSPFDYDFGYQYRVNGDMGEPLKNRDNSQSKPLIIPPESNLSDRSKSHILYLKENFGHRRNILSRRKSFALEKVGQQRISSNKELKIAASTTNVKTFLPEFQEKPSIFSRKNNHFLSKSHDKLLEVQERLNALYKTIHHCNTKEPLVPMLELDSDSNRVHADDVGDTVSGRVNESIENASTIEDLNSTKIAASELNSSVEMKNEDNDDHTNCNAVEQPCDSSSNFTDKNKLDTRHESMEFQPVVPIDSTKILENEETPEDCKEVKPLNDCTSALLHEALRVKQQILSKTKIQNDKIDIKQEDNLSCVETSSDASIQKEKVTFESKILDMITEESSLSSCTEKKTDCQGRKVVKNSKSLQGKTLSEKTKRSCIDEKVKKSRDMNCLPKLSNKSFHAEPSSSRVFPTNFPTILFYNDQDSTYHGKKTREQNVSETNSSQDFVSLTESSSDFSVNILINKLIGNERRSKKSNESSIPEKSTSNDSTHDLTNVDKVKELDPLTESINSTAAFNENKKCTSGIEIPAEKQADNEENDDENPSEFTTCSDSFSQCSSIPKIKCQQSDSKDLNELFLKSNITDYPTNGQAVVNNGNDTQKYDVKPSHIKTDWTINSIDFSYDCNVWKTSRVKSNLELSVVDKHQLKVVHKRSKSCVNFRYTSDASRCTLQKDNFSETTSPSNRYSAFDMLGKKDFSEVDIERNKSSKSLNSIQKSPMVGMRRLNEAEYIERKKFLEFIPILTRLPSKSSIPVIKNKSYPKMKVEEHAYNATKSSTNISLQNEAHDTILKVDKDTDETSTKQITTIRCELAPKDLIISNATNQSDLLNTPLAKLLDETLRNRAIDEASMPPESMNETSPVSGGLSELNPLESLILHNSMPFLSICEIKRKETEVLVKPTTLDTSTSTTNLPCVHHFGEDSKMNDLKILEISDELTKEECIRYLQMFDQDSNCDQSTSTQDASNQLLDNL